MDYYADNDGEEMWSDSGFTVRVAETKVDWMRSVRKKRRIRRIHKLLVQVREDDREGQRRTKFDGRSQESSLGYVKFR